MSRKEAAPILSPERAPWLRAAPLAKLLAALDADGEEARVVGGAVRNTLLELPPGDVDVATTALPNVVVQRAKAAGFHAVPTGIDHGTVTVVVHDRPFEVTTLRQDIETDGRHATVRFGRDWKADAERRDFTINALFANRDGKVFDFVGGLKDIAARRVRFIGNPAQRIAEDHLRILRFFRFHAAYAEGNLDEAGLSACVRGRDRIGQLSRERVRNELMKLLLARHAVPTLAVMTETGILIDVLGGVPYLASISSAIKIEMQLGFDADATRRLAALAVWVREDADRLRERLRLTNEEQRRLRVMAENWRSVVPAAGEAAGRALLYRIGPENFRDRALISFSRSEEKADDSAWSEFIALPGRWAPPKFPLAARDFIERGVAKGPALGAALAQAEEAWIAEGFPADRPSLDRIAERAIAAATTGQ
ncbi:MAG TPA: CCA tRNA nucleotidyltransferase [Xanthobacteraceae bacterium]|jgi:tRNA nucleotidyltransferase/poly(A) polymerase